MSLSSHIVSKLNELENTAEELPSYLFPVKAMIWVFLLLVLMITNMIAVLNWPVSALKKQARKRKGNIGSLMDIKSEAELRSLIASKETVLVDFWAEWCGPCLLMNKSVASVADEFSSSVTVAKVDVSLHSTVSKSFSVKGLPTFIVFKNGQEVTRKPGALSRQQLIEMLS